MAEPIFHSSQTAPVLEFRILWTTQKHQKTKTWHDGYLRLHKFNNRMLIYDDNRTLVTDKYHKTGCVSEGDELNFEHHLVTVEEFLKEEVQDLTPVFSPAIQRKQQKLAAARAINQTSPTRPMPVVSPSPMRGCESTGPIHRYRNPQNPVQLQTPLRKTSQASKGGVCQTSPEERPSWQKAISTPNRAQTVHSNHSLPRQYHVTPQPHTPIISQRKPGPQSPIPHRTPVIQSPPSLNPHTPVSSMPEVLRQRNRETHHKLLPPHPAQQNVVPPIQASPRERSSVPAPNPVHPARPVGDRAEPSSVNDPRPTVPAKQPPQMAPQRPPPNIPPPPLPAISLQPRSRPQTPYQPLSAQVPTRYSSHLSKPPELRNHQPSPVVNPVSPPPPYSSPVKPSTTLPAPQLSRAPIHSPLVQPTNPNTDLPAGGPQTQPVTPNPSSKSTDSAFESNASPSELAPPYPQLPTDSRKRIQLSSASRRKRSKLLCISSASKDPDDISSDEGPRSGTAAWKRRKTDDSQSVMSTAVEEEAVFGNPEVKKNGGFTTAAATLRVDENIENIQELPTGPISRPKFRPPRRIGTGC